jgi:hypothetical protein
MKVKGYCEKTTWVMCGGCRRFFNREGGGETDQGGSSESLEVVQRLRNPTVKISIRSLCGSKHRAAVGEGQYDQRRGMNRKADGRGRRPPEVLSVSHPQDHPCLSTVWNLCPVFDIRRPAQEPTPRLGWLRIAVSFVNG